MPTIRRGEIYWVATRWMSARITARIEPGADDPGGTGPVGGPSTGLHLVEPVADIETSDAPEFVDVVGYQSGVVL